MNKFLWFLARKFGIGIVKLDPQIIIKAEAVVKQVEAIPGVISGDYRRCEALGRMVKRTMISKRDAAMAIELVVRLGAI